ncbi:MAG: hypothetical protein OEV89_08350 [Desulfobulbaceae bacterium]|nr:hypothetical protein [Desulfobulbaceae bacterium]HIJ90702.1 hypothetical protein [Deltaproteobacteria bacterium]
MTTPDKSFRTVFLSTILALTTLVALSGCAELGLGSGNTDQGASSDPFASSSSQDSPSYRDTEFPDLLIPSELSWDREKSMIVRTDSFAGGVLQYSGRVDIASLADFFSNNMVKNGWKLAGSAKYKNILLAFVKPNKTCTILLSEDKLLMRTQVSFYVAEDMAAKRSGDASSANPFGLGM